MSDRPTDWDGTRPPPELGADQPAPVVGHSSPPVPQEDITTHQPQTMEFVLDDVVGHADDSPTIISKTARKSEAVIPANSVRGKVLAHFELLEPVGVGGMAAVIKAHDKQLDRQVALKILPPAMSTDGESLRRFQNEARAAARLDHENIARVFYCGEDQGLHFIAFEYVEGENLRTILDRRGRLPVAEAIKYMLQVAAGLAHASSRGVVHRDIKPSNIVITPTGRAKLVDMGLARSMGPNLDGSLTQSGVTLGTFDYISPEQALEPRDADVRSDIYSLGCTFYHMLTGQPPVPEGTAAKKLHYHQHVPPIDPRQLNPAVNDDVAAVVARMMAKDPKNRYQRPEHLVQHLLHLAQKVGASAEVPEGVMFVDAPLPSPPSVRPLLVGGIAAGALVVLVIAIGFLPTHTSNPDARPLFPLPSARAQTAPKTTDKVLPGGVAKTPTPSVEDPPVTPTANPKQVTVQTTRELTDAVKQATTVLLADRLFDLRARREDGGSEPVGLVLPARDLVLQAEDPARRPTIQLKYDASARDELPLWAAITARGGTVTLRNLRIVIDAAGTETPMACVAADGARLKFEKCEFVHTGFPPDEPERARLCSLQIAGRGVDSRDGLPDVAMDRCFFPGGHQALSWESSARVSLKDCIFGPHGTLFHFRGSKVADAQLELQHVTAMLGDRETVFLLSNGASARLLVNNSLFSRPGGALAEDESGAVLVRQTGDGVGRVRFESESRSVYHNFGAFWVHGTNVRAATLEQFRSLAGLGSGDFSQTASASPWLLEKPRPAIAQTPEKAFQASQELSELRQRDNVARMVGAENALWGSVYTGALRVLKQRIVDPNVLVSDKGVYPTLSQAIGEAQPGDVILLRTNKEILVKPIHLEDTPNVDLTIKPDGGFRPVLKLGTTADVDAAMFRLSDGKLAFENLEFELPAPQAGMTAQCLVQVAGEGQVTFQRCLLTIQENREANNVVRSVQTMGGRPMMRKEPRVGTAMTPRLELKTCFVRGDGNLLTVRGSQALQLEISDSLAVLDGSLFVMEGGETEPPTKPPVSIVLNRVTAYLNEPLLWLKACPMKQMPNLVPTQVSRVNSCVFVSARDKNALVHLDGMDSDEQMKRLFTWGEGTQNVYSGFVPMLEQRPRVDSVMPLSQFDKGKWEDFTPRETERRFERVTFAGVNEKAMSRALPNQFKIKEPELPGCGADVDRLPRPRAEGEAAAPGDE